MKNDQPGQQPLVEPFGKKNHQHRQVYDRGQPVKPLAEGRMIDKVTIHIVLNTRFVEYEPVGMRLPQYMAHVAGIPETAVINFIEPCREV